MRRHSRVHLCFFRWGRTAAYRPQKSAQGGGGPFQPLSWRLAVIFPRTRAHANNVAAPAFGKITHTNIIQRRLACNLTPLHEEGLRAIRSPILKKR